MIFKRWLKYFIALLFHYSGFNNWRIRSSRRHYILMFHRIEEDKDLLNISLPLRHLERVVEWAGSLGSLTSMSDLILSESKSIRFCITFDDGFKNVLKINDLSSDFPCILYLATDYIDTQKKFWAVELERMILTCKNINIDLSSFYLGFFDLSSNDKREIAIKELNSGIKKHHPADIDAIIKYLAMTLDFESESSDNNSFLCWEDIRSLASNGMELGGHTHSHVISSMVTPDEFSNEIKKSNQLIFNEAGINTKHFAYPNGRVQDISVFSREILIDEGYVSAVTTIEGSNELYDDPFYLKRFNVSKERIVNPLGGASKAMFTTMLVNPINIH
ncbi:MAG: polysaccharide deacetylase family protein [Oleispira sp.]